MRRGVTAGLVASAVVAGAVFIAVSLAGNDETTDRSAPSLPSRTVDAGDVDVKIEPRRLDAGAAVFQVTLDTHVVELDVDLPRGARLEVGGVRWDAAAWDGDGPGGHHREGELRFSAAGPAQGTVRLVLRGLPKPVAVAWNLAGQT